MDRYLSEIYLADEWKILPSHFKTALRRFGFYFDIETVRFRQNAKEPHVKPSMMVRQFDPYVGPAGAAVVEVHVRHGDKEYDRVFLDYVVPPDAFSLPGWTTETASARAYIKRAGNASLTHRMKYLDLEPMRLVAIRRAGCSVPPNAFPPPEAWVDLPVSPFEMTDTNRGKAFGPVDLLYHPLGQAKFGVKWDGVEAELRSTGDSLYYTTRAGKSRMAPWPGPKFRLQLEEMKTGPPIVVDVLDAPNLRSATFAERWAWIDTFVANWLNCPYGMQEWFDDPPAVPTGGDGIVVQPCDAPPGRWGIYGTARYHNDTYTIDAVVEGHVCEFTTDGTKVRDRPDKHEGNPPDAAHGIMSAISLSEFRSYHALLNLDREELFPKAWEYLNRPSISHEDKLKAADPLCILACLHPAFVDYGPLSRVSRLGLLPHSKRVPPARRFRSWLLERKGEAVQEVKYPEWLIEVWNRRPLPPTLEEIEALLPPPSGFLSADPFVFNVPDEDLEYENPQVGTSD